jgi:hypothetical protein
MLHDFHSLLLNKSAFFNIELFLGLKNNRKKCKRNLIGVGNWLTVNLAELK